jgi:hypothetical protein
MATPSPPRVSMGLRVPRWPGLADRSRGRNPACRRPGQRGPRTPRPSLACVDGGAGGRSLVDPSDRRSMATGRRRPLPLPVADRLRGHRLVARLGGGSRGDAGRIRRRGPGIWPRFRPLVGGCWWHRIGPWSELGRRTSTWHCRNWCPDGAGPGRQLAGAERGRWSMVAALDRVGGPRTVAADHHPAIASLSSGTTLQASSWQRSESCRSCMGSGSGRRRRRLSLRPLSCSEALGRGGTTRSSGSGRRCWRSCASAPTTTTWPTRWRGR